MTGAHSAWGPSGAERWMVCHASVQESAKAPKRLPSKYALEGTHAHALLEHCLNNQITRVRDMERQILDPAQGHITQEMCDYVQEAVDHVHEILRADASSQWWVEKRVHVLLAENPGDVWGTADIIIWQPSLGILHIIDFKYGAGIAVEAQDNPQLKSYGKGGLDFIRSEIGTDPTYVLLHIVQPRAFHALGPVRYDDTQSPGSLDYFAQEIDAAVTATKGDNPAYVVGEEQCRWCDGALTCKALEAEALRVAGESFKDVRTVSPRLLPQPEIVGMDKVAYVLQAGAILKKWLNTYEDYALEQARSGIFVPGHKLVAASSRRKLDDHLSTEELAQAVIDIADGELTAEQVSPRRMLGLGDLEKLLKQPRPDGTPLTKPEKSARIKAFNYLCPKQRSSNLTLVPETDSRPALTPTQLAFGDVSLPDA